MSTSKILIGFINHLGDFPSFSTPIFIEDGQQYIQEINDQGIISEFVPVNVPEDIIIACGRELTLDIGQLAVYAFQLSQSETFMGSKEEIGQKLRLHYQSFRNYSFLRWEIADFLDDNRLKAQAVLDSFESILKLNPNIEIQFREKIFWVGPSLSSEFDEQRKRPINRRLLSKSKRENRTYEVFRSLYKEKPEAWVQYLIMTAGTFGNMKQLGSVLKEIRWVFGERAFIDGLSDILIARKNQIQTIDSLFGALNITSKNNIDMQFIIQEVINKMMEKGYKEVRIADIKVGKDYAQLALLAGTEGDISTSNKVAFEILRKKWEPEVDIDFNIEELKENVVSAQESLFEYSIR